MEKQKRKGPYEAFFKRILDVFFSLIIMVLFCWLYGIIALFVRIKLGNPVIFAQERPGMIDRKTGKERLFKLYKFRTMTNQRDATGKLLSDTERLNPFGRMLRASSLDELPELYNILIGDMSFVGPRPLAVSYLPYYSKEERRRHEVRPGLSGLAQVNGRNSLSWEEKFSYDVEYVDNISALMDIQIVWKTIISVLKRDGIGQAEEAPESLSVERSKKLKKNI